MDKAKSIFQAYFSDGTFYSLVFTEDKNFSVLIDSPDISDSIMSTHETLTEALEFLKGWSEEILKEAAK
ncbi:hypothetical protein LGV83_11495 [Enterococcus durans]|uniref:hypothetical protein n=1 Tax=Enterococcus TaxID=1350 RepID=UPI0013F47662|nr:MULTISPECIES: hypothetical protein [Enterococcus]MDQ7172058.1 hypothetical protein [Klebsiella pneumoniae subsp. pneumoniae]NHB74423.1 hypothetical protein [Enterococcus faecium]MCG3448630.1 hypothetical protein [Enterococcus durans]MCU7356549.1 hypothetical protein [Enterococcus dispar]MDT2772714.1 hypothetical protein [Enterococcus durans]